MFMIYTRTKFQRSGFGASFVIAIKPLDKFTAAMVIYILRTNTTRASYVSKIFIHRKSYTFHSLLAEFLSPQNFGIINNSKFKIQKYGDF